VEAKCLCNQVKKLRGHHPATGKREFWFIELRFPPLPRDIMQHEAAQCVVCISHVEFESWLLHSRFVRDEETFEYGLYEFHLFSAVSADQAGSALSQPWCLRLGTWLVTEWWSRCWHSTFNTLYVTAALHSYATRKLCYHFANSSLAQPPAVCCVCRPAKRTELNEVYIKFRLQQCVEMLRLDQIKKNHILLDFPERI
jgi:hypothetical protein